MSFVPALKVGHADSFFERLSYVNSEEVLHRKRELRRFYLKERLKLSFKEVLKRSLDIQKRVLELKEFKESKRLAIYSSFKNEVLTDKIFQMSLRDGKRVFFPRVVMDKGGLVFNEVAKEDELTIGSYDVLEPVRKEDVSISSFDLMVVPGLAFDIYGNRLGYGKGYYDRVLPHLKGKKPIIGLAFGFQVLSEIPALSRDIKMDKIVTEERVVESFR